MVIGDHLSDEQKKEYIRSRLVPGAVIYRYCDFTKPPKVKYLLVVQVKADTAVLVINSEINAFTKSNQHLLDCQVSIDQANHSFLDYDSHIDCTEAHYIDTAQLTTELFQNLDCLQGNITADLRQSVIAGLSESYTISPAEIGQLVASLST